jgi:hypothetical protein
VAAVVVCAPARILIVRRRDLDRAADAQAGAGTATGLVSTSASWVALITVSISAAVTP